MKPRAAAAAVVALAVAAGVWPNPAGAAEWRWQPRLELGTTYDDNPRLEPGDHGSTSAFVAPAAVVHGRSERLTLEAQLAARLERYWGDRSYAPHEYRLALTPGYVWQDQQITLATTAARELTVRDELAATGRALAYSRRDLYTLAPQWRKTATERVDLRVSYRFSRVGYREPGLVDYALQRAAPAVETAVTQRLRTTLESYWSRFQANATGFRSDELGARLTGEARWTETVTAVLAAGGRGTVTRFPGRGGETRDRSAGWLLRTDLRADWLEWDVQLGYARSTEPSGEGLTLELDHATASITRRLTATLAASLGFDLYASRPVAGGSGRKARAHRIEQSWRWQWAEHWALGAAVRRRFQDVDDAEARASNAVSVTLSYGGSERIAALEPLTPEGVDNGLDE